MTTTIEKIQQFLQELGPNTPDIDAVVQTEDPSWAIQFSDETIVIIEPAEDPPRMVLSSELGSANESLQLPIYETLLCYNLLWRETGGVKILRYTVAHDCGRVINPMVVEGQVIGGVAHGVGNALYEQLAFDENAQPLSTNFGEYLLPMATDVPHVDLVHLETPSPLNPLGIKGAGEGGTISAIGAILGAVEHALEPFGVHIAEAPISPQRIVALLGEHARGRTK